MSMFPESLSQRILGGIIVVGRLGVVLNHTTSLQKERQALSSYALACAALRTIMLYMFGPGRFMQCVCVYVCVYIYIYIEREIYMFCLLRLRRSCRLPLPLMESEQTNIHVV